MLERQIVKFIMIGFLSTVVNYGVFYVLYEFFSVHYILSSAIGFVTGVFSGYKLNKAWTFGVEREKSGYVYGYFTVYVVSLFLGLGFLNFLVAVLGLVPELANVLSVGLTTCTNFIGIKFLVFRK